MRLFVRSLCALTAVVANCATSGSALAESPPYRVISRYQIGGSETGYDYVRLDAETRYLYVAHGNRVEVLNADTGAGVGVIADTHGVHGIEIVASLKRGFTSNGLDRTVTMFDATTLKVIKVIPGLGIKPDAIHYDSDTKRLFVVNGGASGDVTVIDPESGAITATVPLGGAKLEQIAFDGHGRAFVNDEEQNVIHVFDTHTFKPITTWSIAPGDAPTGIAIDIPHHLLFSACGNNLLVVVDYRSGKVVATPAIGADPDGAVFDATSARIFYVQ